MVRATVSIDRGKRGSCNELAKLGRSVGGTGLFRGRDVGAGLGGAGATILQ